MLNEKIARLINEQVNKELYSGYLYLDFANYYEDEGLDGFAHWYQIQAQEERDHAMMMRRYLIDNGFRVTFDAIAKPDKTFKTTSDPLDAGYEHEKFVTSLINNIYAEAFAVPRLVYQRAGRGGKERGGPDKENETLRARREGALFP